MARSDIMFVRNNIYGISAKCSSPMSMFREKYEYV